MNNRIVNTLICIKISSKHKQIVSMASSIRTVFTYILVMVVVLACVGSVLGTYYVLDKNLNISLHLINIPFYVVLGICIFLIPLIQVRDDCCFLKEKTAITLSTLFRSIYLLNLIHEICEKIFYSAIVPFTVYLLGGLDDHVNYVLAGYLKALGIYILLIFIRHWIGAVWEIYYEDGKIFCYRDADVGDDKDQTRLNHLFRMYFCKRDYNGIQCRKINCTSILDPLPISIAICLFRISDAFIQGTTESLMITMNQNVTIIYTAVIIHIVVNSFLMLIMLIMQCIARDNMPCGIVIYVYFLLVSNNVITLCGVYFYNGLMTMIHNLSISASYDLSFMFIILGIMVWYAYMFTFLFVYTVINDIAS